MNSREAPVAFSALAANVYLEIQAIQTIVAAASWTLYHLPPEKLDHPFEHHAVAAVMSQVLTGGDLHLAAKGIHDHGLWLSDRDCRVISRAIRLIRTHPDFSNELFNGDAGPLIREAIANASESIGS